MTAYGTFGRHGKQGLILVLTLCGLLVTIGCKAEEKAMPVVSRATWDPDGGESDTAKLKEHGKSIFSIVLHHTQTPNEPAAMERARLRGIRRFHRDEKGCLFAVSCGKRLGRG